MCWWNSEWPNNTLLCLWASLWAKVRKAQTLSLGWRKATTRHSATRKRAIFPLGLKVSQCGSRLDTRPANDGYQGYQTVFSKSRIDDRMFSIASRWVALLRSSRISPPFPTISHDWVVCKKLFSNWYQNPRNCHEKQMSPRTNRPAPNRWMRP